ncbi:hypothetical protein [Robbsia sp. KACC 23696]|uniref:hypothetical protein n=1 Tax=Robbsia sp. KACC 23696 TaxID=3149231 RepID=UPI00325A8CF4
MIGTALDAIGREESRIDIDIDACGVARAQPQAGAMGDIAIDAVTIGAFFKSGCDGKLFETDRPGFLLKETEPYGSMSPEDERGGEVECFQAMYGEDAARRVGKDRFLLRKFPGVDIGDVYGELDIDDARNLLRKVAEMHAKGIAHRDITMTFGCLVKNVLFDRATREFYIIDFGASTFYTEEAMKRPPAIAQFTHEYAKVRESILEEIGLSGSAEADSV